MPRRSGVSLKHTHLPTRWGNVYILVISDYFSKYTDAFPLWNMTVYNCAKTLMETWIVYHGVPMVIHSDQGREFEGRVFQRLAELLGAVNAEISSIKPGDRTL